MRIRWMTLSALALAAVPLSFLQPWHKPETIMLASGPVARLDTALHGYPKGARPRQKLASQTSGTTRRWSVRLATPKYLSGVVEGFYGPTWSNRNTIQVFKFMSQHHLNTFVYAPKNATYLRKSWNQPYPAPALTHLAELAVAARGLHINFVVSISPGLSMIYSSATDRKALLAKINQLRSIGVQNFMLSFDDIPQTLDAADQAVYGNNLGRAQSALTNYVLGAETQSNPGFHLMFTPTVYWGVSATPYWDSLRQYLNPAIPVAWTGPNVLSQTITTEDVKDAQGALGHPLIIWDNYPVNDYSYVMDHKPQLFMGPVVGRQARVVGAVKGYLFNPMLQPLASEVALWTAASFLRDPSGYNASRSWGRAVAAIGGKAAPAFKIFCEDSSASFLDPSASNAVASEAPAFWSQYQSRGNLKTTGLYRTFAAMAQVNAQLAHNLRPGLYQEIKPWAQQLSLEGSAGVSTIEILERNLEGQVVPASASNSTLAALNQAMSSPITLGVSAAVNQWMATAKALSPLAP